MRRFASLFLMLASSVALASITRSRPYPGAGGGGSITDAYGSGSIVRAMVGAAQAATCSGNFVTDTFTESGSGTINLNTHTPEVGGTWAGPGASDGSVVVDRANDNVRLLVSGAYTPYLSVTPSCVNYTVSVVGQPGSTSATNRAGIIGRWDSATSSGYRFQIEGNGTARLTRVDAGVDTDLGTASIPSFSATTNATILLRCDGSIITGYYNGTSEVSATDVTYPTAGKVGMLLRNSSSRITSISGDYI